MNNVSFLSGDMLSLAALRRVDDICARFENLWRTGQRPRLEEFLNGTQGRSAGSCCASCSVWNVTTVRG